MLDYISKRRDSTPMPNLEEEDIEGIVDTNVTGTNWNNIKNINSALAKSNPSIEFISEFGPHDLDDIRKELQKELPVAVWIKTNDGSNDYLHSVIITGIDDEKRQISYNDPTYGAEKTISQSSFLDIWQYPQGARMIKVEIGRFTIQSIEEFMTKEGAK